MKEQATIGKNTKHIWQIQSTSSLLGSLIMCLAVIGSAVAGDSVPAFPGAEGAGAFALGGRGGQVIKVTNVNDDGPGSLRQAVGTAGARIIVFEVSGNIMLQSRLTIREPFVTIAGQTAPGDGIALIGEQVTIDAHDVIIRYLRFRATDLANSEVDALNDGYNHHNSIIDHCTFSWSVDETLSVYRGGDITVQWCMITESLYNSIHSKGNHGYGGIWGGTNASFHHNLLAHHTSRTPRFDREVSVDHRNSVIYNWGFNSAYGGEGSNMNIVNNYYKYGPATQSSKRYRIFQASDIDSKAYVSGNYVYGNSSITKNNWSGGVQYHGSGEATESTLRVYSPFEAAPVTTTGAQQAYVDVLADAGASYPNRDAIDSRIINEVKTGGGSYGSSFDGGGNGIIDSQFDLCPDGDDYYCWLPVLSSTPPPADSDDDGMSDGWEDAHCLDPFDSTDGNTDRNGDGYTNIEEYINWLPLRQTLPIRRKTDFNCDSRVNPDDLAMFAEHYPSAIGSERFDKQYDLNDDNRIMLDDFVYIAQDWIRPD